MEKISQYIKVLVGLFIVACAFNLFLAPNNYVTGGVSGLSIIVKQLFYINESIFMFLVNIFLVILSYILLGKEKTKNTILGSLLFPVFTFITQYIRVFIPIQNLDPLIIIILGGALSGIGYGLIFKNNFTSGGTDILNQICEKYFKIPMSKSIMYVDGSIVILGCAVFGLTKMLYSLIALVLISVLSNKIQLGINQNRVLYIASEKTKDIKKYLSLSGYDITLLKTTGGYSNQKQKLIICSINKNDYYKIKEGIKVVDPNVFFIVTKAYDLENANVNLRNKSKIDTRKIKVLEPIAK